MSTQRALRLVLRSALLTAAVGASLHAGGDADAQPRPGFGPPPVLFEACSGRRSGEACSVDFRGRRVDGTCTPGPDQRVFCRPAGVPDRRPPG